MRSDERRADSLRKRSKESREELVCNACQSINEEMIMAEISLLMMWVQRIDILIRDETET